MTFFRPDSARRTRLVHLLLLLLGFSFPLAAKPNFTGTWVLDASESYLGPLEKPSVLVRTITHNAPLITIEINGEQSTGSFDGEIRGITSSGEVEGSAEGRELSGTMMWLGDRLLLETTRVMNELDIRMHELWSLSEDGNTLRIDAVVSSMSQKHEIRAVFKRKK